MKKLLLLIFVQFGIGCFGQTIAKDNFKFEGKEFTYTNIGYMNPPVTDFFVIISTDLKALAKYQRMVLKCAEEHHRYYMFEMPDELSDDAKAALFLEFMATILGRTKLVESKFVLIADDTYTTKYFEILASGGRYRHGLLNTIEQSYIRQPVDMCEIIK